MARKNSEETAHVASYFKRTCQYYWPLVGGAGCSPGGGPSLKAKWRASKLRALRRYGGLYSRETPKFMKSVRGTGEGEGRNRELAGWRTNSWMFLNTIQTLHCSKRWKKDSTVCFFDSGLEFTPSWTTQINDLGLHSSVMESARRQQSNFA